MARPLTKTDHNGHLYTRAPSVEAAIDAAIGQDLETLTRRAAIANRFSPEFLPLECLVHLIRDARPRGDEDTMSALLPRLLGRCDAILKKKMPTGATGNWEEFRAEILGDFAVLFAEDGSDEKQKLDFFECRFNQAFRYFRIPYPEYAAPITDLAVSIVLDAARGNDDEAESDAVPSVSQAVSLAMSRFQNRLYEVRRTKPAVQAVVSSTPGPIENPFSTLDRTAFRALATRMHCNTVFLGMLRDREIDPNTIPGGFTRQLGEEMSVPPELLAAHFAAEQTLLHRQSYKADEKPRVGAKVSFDEAVRSCGLSEEQQAYLLGL